MRGSRGCRVHHFPRLPTLPKKKTMHPLTSKPRLPYLPMKSFITPWLFLPQVEVTSSNITRGCGTCNDNRDCCPTDLCNNERSSPTPPIAGAGTQCYDCTYRESNGVKYGHSSCTWEEFDQLHPLVKTKMCSTGCLVSKTVGIYRNVYRKCIDFSLRSWVNLWSSAVWNG